MLLANGAIEDWASPQKQTFDFGSKRRRAVVRVPREALEAFLNTRRLLSQLGHQAGAKMR
jgi:hypothetical protein